MAENTKIEWADATVNHWAGCTKVSPACDNCYAERMAGRLWAVPWGAGATRKQFISARDMLEALDRKAQRLGRPLRVFHNSLSDLFDNEVPGAWRMQALSAIVDTPHLIHLLLTKRIGNARAMLDESIGQVNRWRETRGVAPIVWPLPNVWLGATVVNQEEADRDIPKLLTVPAAKRFLSLEPLLGPVDIQAALNRMPWRIGGGEAELHWIIVGSESGPGARRDPNMVSWVASLRDQCVNAGVAFLWKQDVIDGKKIGAPQLEGQSWQQFPA